MKVKIVLVLMVCLMLSSFVLSLGVNPGSQEIKYSKGIKNFKMDVLNTNSASIICKVNIASNDFGDKVQLDRTEFRLLPSGIGTIKGTINIDDDLKPGQNCVRYYIEEMPDEDVGMISARTAIISRVCIFVPYPGKYIEPRFDQQSAIENSFVYFTINLASKGKDVINSVVLNARIYDSEDTLVDELPLKTIEGLVSLEEKSIPFKTTKELKGGEYTLKLLLEYDGNQDTFEYPLRVGTPEVEIKSVSEEIKLKNGIATYTMLVKSLWNDPFNNLYGEIKIPQISNDGFKTSVLDINSWAEAELKGYIDHPDLIPGTYDATYTVHFANNKTKSIEKQVAVIDASNEVETPIETLSNSKANTMFNPLGIGMIVFGFAIIIYIVFTYSSKKNEDREDL
jgi:hypothetical protein